MQLTENSSTERYSSEARLLLHEFSHRINNEFASAIGMISVAAEHLGNGEAKAALAAVQDQLHNYARVQHALQMPEHSSRIDAAVYLAATSLRPSRNRPTNTLYLVWWVNGVGRNHLNLNRRALGDVFLRYGNVVE